jgi:hypothetical protein
MKEMPWKQALSTETLQPNAPCDKVVSPSCLNWQLTWELIFKILAAHASKRPIFQDVVFGS